MEFSDPNVYVLYLSVRTEMEPMINDIQREAVLQLGTLTRHGNGEALEALHNLSRTSNLHPLLREMISTELRISGVI
jgi:hypothetical protein